MKALTKQEVKDLKNATHIKLTSNMNSEGIAFTCLDLSMEFIEKKSKQKVKVDLPSINFIPTNFIIYKKAENKDHLVRENRDIKFSVFSFLESIHEEDILRVFQNFIKEGDIIRVSNESNYRGFGVDNIVIYITRHGKIKNKTFSFIVDFSNNTINPIVKRVN